MKKTLILASAIALFVAAGCSNEELGQETIPMKKVTLGAEVLETKANLGSDGAFTWNEGDQVAAYTTAGAFYPLTLQSGAGTDTGSFEGEIPQSANLTGVAVYPVSAATAYDASTGKLTYTFPETYEYNKSVTQVPLVAKLSENATSASFKQIGGVIRFTFTDLDPETLYTTSEDKHFRFAFSSDLKITGDYEVDLSTETPQIIGSALNLSLDQDSDGKDLVPITEDNTVYVTCDSPTSAVNTYVFNVPVPVGVYKPFTARLLRTDRTDQDFWHKTVKSSKNDVTAGKLLVMPTLQPVLSPIGGEVTIIEPTVLAVDRIEFVVADEDGAYNVYKYKESADAASCNYNDSTEVFGIGLVLNSISGYKYEYKGILELSNYDPKSEKYLVPPISYDKKKENGELVWDTAVYPDPLDLSTTLGSYTTKENARCDYIEVIGFVGDNYSSTISKSDYSYESNHENDDAWLRGQGVYVTNSERHVWLRYLLASSNIASYRGKIAKVNGYIVGLDDNLAYTVMTAIEEYTGPYVVIPGSTEKKVSNSAGSISFDAKAARNVSQLVCSLEGVTCTYSDNVFTVTYPENTAGTDRTFTISDPEGHVLVSVQQGETTALVDLPYNQNFTEGIGKFTTDGVKVNNVEVWRQTSEYGMKATSYVSQKYDADSKLISPRLNLPALSNGESIKLKFSQAINKYFGTVANEALLMVKEDGGAWTKIDITYPALSGTYSSFEEQVVDLSSYAGKKIQIAFRYIGTTDNSGTWEIKELSVAKYAPVTLSSISVSGQKTTFVQGDTFSFGGTVTAHYSDGSTKDVREQAAFSGYNLSTTGEQTVTVSYTEGGVTKTTTYTITVNPVPSGSALPFNDDMSWANSSSDSNSDISSSISTESEGLYTSASGKVYKGIGGLKLGSNNSNGTITTKALNLAGAFHIVIEGAAWSGDDNNIVVSIDETVVINEAFSSLHYVNIPASTYTSSSQVTIGTSAKRGRIYSVTIASGEYTPPAPSPVINVTTTTPIAVANTASSQTIEYSISNPTSATLTASTTASWITNINYATSGRVTFNVAAQQTGAAARSGVITLSYTGAADVEVSVNQAAGPSSGGGSSTTTLTNANIVAAGNANSGYKSWSLTDSNDNSYSAYAIKNYHSNATSAYHYLQIKKYSSNTAYYISIPELGTKITSIKMTVSGASQPMTGGGNSTTLFFSASNSTSSAGTGIASGTGTSSVTINCSSLDLNHGYITASGAVRIWDIEVTYNN